MRVGAPPGAADTSVFDPALASDQMALPCRSGAARPGAPGGGKSRLWQAGGLANIIKGLAVSGASGYRCRGDRNSPGEKSIKTRSTEAISGMKYHGSQAWGSQAWGWQARGWQVWVLLSAVAIGGCTFVSDSLWPSLTGDEPAGAGSRDSVVERTSVR